MKSSAVVVVLSSILFSLNPVFAYDIVEYFSKDVQAFKAYGEYVNDNDWGKKFLTITFVAHVHYKDDPSDRKKVIQSYRKICNALIRDKWMYEDRQRQNVGLVIVSITGQKVWTEIENS